MAIGVFEVIKLKKMEIFNLETINFEDRMEEFMDK